MINKVYHRENRVIIFMVITYNAKIYSSPPYLASQLKFKSNPRNLRHHDPLLLEISRSHSARMGDRTFSFVAPTIWNPLPFSIRNSCSIDVFKISLKKHLFSSRFRDLL